MNTSILLVEDNADHASLIMECAQKGFNGLVEIDWVPEFNLALEKLKQGKYHIALIDLNLPDSNVDETMDVLGSLNIQIPIIVLTSTDDDRIAKSLIHQGVQDYCSKTDLNPKLLYKICTYAVERKKNMVELERRNRDQSLFCQSLSHDFRAPIWRISNLLKDLKAQLDFKQLLEELELDRFSVIEKNLKNINELVDGLYNYLSIGDKEMLNSNVDINELVKECADAAIDESNISVNVEITNLVSVDGHREQLYILFYNLINNAIKYCQREPHIKISCELKPKEEFCRYFIKDNGIGIDQKHFEKIFDPFQRLHNMDEYPGAGLGLSLAKKIVENHNGRISVESAPGMGSTFMIDIPYTQFA